MIEKFALFLFLNTSKYMILYEMPFNIKHISLKLIIRMSTSKERVSITNGEERADTYYCALLRFWIDLKRVLHKPVSTSYIALRTRSVM